MQGRFVIQEHTTPQGVHWDLMLEDGEHLLTWRVDVGPGELGTVGVEAVKIFDHPLRFLTYEGPVQQETGQVRIADRGTYERMGESEKTLNFHLHGQIVRGLFRLEKQGETWDLRRMG